MNTANSLMERRTEEVAETRVAPGVWRLQHGIVNSYMIEDLQTGAWVLVDAGLTPFSASKIIHEATLRFGQNKAPLAIVLTHAHFDHIGALKPLLKHWDIPVYLHALELPYVTGLSSYPPPDPTVGGGLMARFAALYPRRAIQIGDRARILPEDGLLPGLPGWRWLHTPGHSPGHVSLFRVSDHTLIAGDAFVTVKQESLRAVWSQTPEVHGPPAYFTPDWEAARTSINSLVELEPATAATGHGVPMSGFDLREGLERLVWQFDTEVKPRHGRYVREPAKMDTRGMVYVPPRPANPVNWVATGLALAGLLAWWGYSRRRAHRVEP